MQRLLSQIGRSQRLSVVNHLKRSPEGLTVAELAARLGLSYMGAKQHCVELERDGYLDTFRRHRGVGRPELLYRLTTKAQDLFPKADNSLSLSLLEQARKLYGSGAAEKLLYLHFQQQATDYASKLEGGTLAERAEAFAKLREREGYMAETATEPLRVIERHHPMLQLLDTFPQAADLERDALARLFGVPLRREVTRIGGNYECTYFLEAS